jgi:hypothetical protein
MALPEAATKLRMVLDYLPCEACLAQPVADQDLLCTLCARVDRQVAVRVGARTTVLIERPSAPEAPVLIPAAAPEPPAAQAPAAPREIVVRMVDEPSQGKPGTIEVVVEPLIPLAPPAQESVPLAEEPELDFDVSDIVDFVPARDQFFDYRRSPAHAPQPEPELEPQYEPEPPFQPEPEPPAQDDFVFRPPPQEEPAPEPVEETLLPTEEVIVESPAAVDEWAPREEAEPQVLEIEEAEDEVLDMEIVEDEEDAIVEMELVEPEPIEMALVEDETPAPRLEPDAPSGTGELYRLRGFDVGAEGALARLGITEIAQLSGDDAGELAARARLPEARLAPWIQVADLVHEVGVPVDAAVALVAAGVAGPRGLREGDANEIADRAAAFGGFPVRASDVKRWQRRA